MSSGNPIDQESKSGNSSRRTPVMTQSSGTLLEGSGYDSADTPDSTTPATLPHIVWFPPPHPTRTSSLTEKNELVESPDGSPTVSLLPNLFHPPVPTRTSSLTDKSISLKIDLADESSYQVPSKKLHPEELLLPNDHYSTPTPPLKPPRKFPAPTRVAPPVPSCAPFGKKKTKEYRDMDKDWEVKSLKF